MLLENTVILSDESKPYLQPPTFFAKAGKRHQKQLGILAQLAMTVPPVANARLAASLVYKGVVVAFGINCRKSNPFQKRFGRNEDAIYLHAETAAIRNALRLISLDEISRSTLYICRMKYSDAINQLFVSGLSRPCSGCQKAIAQFKIKKVVYSVENMGYDVL